MPRTTCTSGNRPMRRRDRYSKLAAARPVLCPRRSFLRSHAESVRRALPPLQRPALCSLPFRAGARLGNCHRRGWSCGRDCGRLRLRRVRPRGAVAGGGAPTVAPARPACAATSCARDYAGSARCAGCHADVVRRLEGRSDAPHDAACRRGRASGRPFDGTTFHFKDDTARLTEKDGARFVALTSPARRRPPLSRHARHRRPLPRGLRRHRGRRGGREAATRSRADPAALVRLRDAELSPQGLLGAGDGAAGAARGRRLEPDLHLLPQHRSVLRRTLGRALRPRRARLSGRGRR